MASKVWYRYGMSRRYLAGTLALISTFVCTLPGEERYKPSRDPESPPDIPYTRYHTQDRFGRRITFYIHGDQNQRLPLVVSVMGSGAYSNFIRRDDRILDAHRTDREVFAERAHVLIVEKPGIEFLEQHPDLGTETHAPLKFRQENTLERWAEAVTAALRAARSLSLADHSRCLLIGHSEGSIVVSRVAAENGFITHVATLAAGGPTILFELIEEAREGRLYATLPPDPDKQLAQLLADIAAIHEDPRNPEKLVLGHPHRYWSSFLPSSEMEELSSTKARIFIAHGTADRKVAVTNFDVLYAHLLALGKDVIARRINGADHSFGFADQPNRFGWKEIFEEIRDWFFQ